MNSLLNPRTIWKLHTKSQAFLDWHIFEALICTLSERARAFGHAKAVVQIFVTDVQVSQKDPRLEIFKRKLTTVPFTDVCHNVHGNIGTI